MVWSHWVFLLDEVPQERPLTHYLEGHCFSDLTVAPCITVCSPDIEVPTHDQSVQWPNKNWKNYGDVNKTCKRFCIAKCWPWVRDNIFCSQKLDPCFQRTKYCFMNGQQQRNFGGQRFPSEVVSFQYKQLLSLFKMWQVLLVLRLFKMCIVDVYLVFLIFFKLEGR